jgi:hypothetical protein
MLKDVDFLAGGREMIGQNYYHFPETFRESSHVQERRKK